MTLPLRMPAIVREIQSGAFSPSAYYWAKTASDIPFEIFFTIIWSGLTYWLINLGDDFPNFLVFTGIQLLCAMVASGIGYWAGFLFANPAVAFLFCILQVSHPHLILTSSSESSPHPHLIHLIWS